MELRHLATFKAVADRLSFTRATRDLHLAQSSISAQVKALEEELGVRLFDRIGRRIRLTDAGRELYQYAGRMLEMTKEIQSQISGTGSAQALGRLTVRVPETLAAVHMPGILTAFHRAYPRVVLEFMNCSDVELKEELNAGKIDLAFLLTESVSLNEVNIRMLGTEPLVMVTGPDHPFMAMPKVRWKDLEGRTLMLPKTD